MGWGSAKNKSITERIDADARSLARQGVELSQWGPDWCSGKVKVYLTHYSRAAARILTAAYGSAIIVSRRSTPLATPAGRSGDTSPFSGGDFITSSGGSCTGGPIVVVNGTSNNRMLGAGHCDTLVGDEVFRSNRNGDVGPIMGKVETVRFCNNCIDSETIKPDATGAHYNHDVWGGGDTGNVIYTEDGSAFPGNGDRVTQDSAVTGEITGLTVVATNQMKMFTDGVTRVLLTEVQDARDICHKGDSGGPWIQHEGSTSNVKVVGTTVGCTFGAVFTDGWYQQIGSIDSFFGVHVPTAGS
jgi:hypothetical protein